MNEQQLAAVKQALEALEKADSRDGYLTYITEIEALHSIIRQDAMHRLAEESRTSGLRLDDWDKIGCVNHDCDQCKAVLAPFDEGFVGTWLEMGAPETFKNVTVKDMLIALQYFSAAQPAPVKCWCHKCNEHNTINGLPFSMTQMILCPECGNKRCPKASDHQLDCTGSNEPNQPGSVYTAPQPVPVKTYSDGKPWPVAPVPNGPYSAPIKELWPVAPKPWVGLSEKEVEAYDSWADFQVGCGRQTLFDMVRDIEAKLKEKNT
jgi:hypothetical protein